MTKTITNTIRIALLIFAGVLLAICPALSQTRPNPTPIRGSINLGLPTTSWEMNSRDTLLTEPWSKVDIVAITQPTTPDSLRFWSSSESDSTKLTITGIDSSGNEVSVTATTSGADSVFISTYKWSRINGVFLDTTCVGTLTFKAKTGTGNLFTIPIGDMQTYSADYFFGLKGGTITQLAVFSEPFSPMVEFQLRIYRHQGNSINYVEKNYSTLFRGQTSGPPTIRPHVAKQIVAANNDTSVTFFLSSAGTAYNWAAVTTSVATTNTAYYVISSPDGTTFDEPGTAIDSLSGGSAVTNNLRYKALTLNSATGPYYKFVANGKGASGDTSTITTYVFPATWNQVPSPIIIAMDEACPSMSRVSLYARAHGKNGKITVKLRGTITK